MNLVSVGFDWMEEIIILTFRLSLGFWQTVESLGHAALTFLAALVLCLMFESPIHGIEKVLLRRGE